MNFKIDASKIKNYVLLTGLYLSGPAFISLTDPSKLALPLLVLPFLWLFACIFVTAWILLKRSKSIRKRQAGLLSGVVASIPVLLLVFQSIHQLSVRDVLLSVGLVVLAAVYMYRADFIR